MTTELLLRKLLWCLAVGFCQFSFVNTFAEDLENTPIVGYTTTDCSFDSETDKKQEFGSVRALYADGYLNNNNWWSYHPQSDEGDCRSLVESMTVVGQRRSSDISTNGFVDGIGFLTFWKTSQVLRGITNPRVANGENRQLQESRDADACWRQQAAAKGDEVEYNSTRYTLRIDNDLDSQGRFLGDAIAINYARIEATSGANTYAYLVQVLIHESWHGNQPWLRSEYYRERWVQEKTYHTWIALYGDNMEPPLGFRTIEELNVLYDEWKQIDNIAEAERSDQELARFDELHELMKQSPHNGNYDPDGEQIPQCD